MGSMKNLTKAVTVALLMGALLFAGAEPARGASDAEATIIRILEGIYQQGTQPPLAPAGTATSANQTNGAQKAIAMPVQGAPTDRSGTITTGGTSQTLAAALSTRTYIEIQNISDETMYINFGAAATVDSNSFKIVAGGSYVNPAHFCPTGTITIIGATTGKKFVAKEG